MTSSQTQGNGQCLSSEIYPGRSWVLGAGCWRTTLLGSWPGPRGSSRPTGAQDSAMKGATQQPLLMQHVAGKMLLEVWPQPWANRSAHSLASLQAMMGQTRTQAWWLHRRRIDGWSFWSLRSTPLSRHIQTSPPWLLSPYKPGAFFRKTSRLTPPCNVPWMSPSLINN